MRKSIQNVLVLFVVIVSIFTFINMVSVDRAEAVSVVACPVGYTCTPTPVCPVGYVCTPIEIQPTTCPPGYICTPTTNISGPLVLALQDFPSGVTLVNGESKDIARYKLQTSDSDMQVKTIALDFDTRLWLYASSIVIKDDAGTVVASKNGLVNSDFVEFFVAGSSYRLQLPINYTIPKTTTKYLTVNISTLAVSNRCTSNCTLKITSAQVRSVDGTGVVNTQTDASDRTFTLSTPVTNSCYRFETNLSVGSTGADVVALQTLLIAKGFDIPDISSAEGTKGYFGSGTKTAVMRYQTSIGIPATGFVGPLTRKALNGLCNSLESVTVSNTSAVLGSPINQANVVIAFPVTLNFTINNNREVPIYLSSKASEILNPSGFNEPPIVSYSGVLASSPTTLSGDSVKIFVIPSGTSRTFKVNGVMKNNGGKAGLKTLKVGYIFYRLSADSEKVELIKDGLENLEISAVFGDDSIHQPSIKVLSPTGGIYKIGDSMQILWNTANIPPNQDMEISLMLDAVGIGKPIASVKNTGSYTWKVTDIKAFYDSESRRMIYPNGNYKIDVICAGDNDVCDSMTSNFGQSATFAIATSTTPIQTPSYTPVPSTNATLSAELLPTNTDKAGQWSVFAPGNGAGGVGGTTDSADWNWSMDMNLMAEKKISSVTVRQTNGEYWSTDNRTYFPLVIIDSSGRQLNNQYSNDLGSFRPGQYKWTLYGQKNTSAWVGGYVTVVFSDGTKVSANITGKSWPSITVSAPSGGQIKKGSSNVIISWKHTAPADHEFGINLLKTNGDIMSNIKLCSTASTKTQESGSLYYVWKAGYDAYGREIANGNYKILVYDCAGITTSGESAIAVELISSSNINSPAPTPYSAPSAKVISPNGGETWTIGQTYLISTASNGELGTRTIKLNRYSDDSVRIGSEVIGTTNTDSFYFKVPVGTAETRYEANRYKIQVQSNRYNEGMGVADESDGYISIVSSAANPPPSVTVTSPNSGEIWSIGDRKTITWSYANWNSGIFGNKYVDMYLVPMDGRSPMKLATNFNSPDGTVHVTIYEKTSDGRNAWLPGRYKIRVVCNTNNVAPFNSCVDESDGYITVIATTPAPTPTPVSSPTSMIDQDSLNASIWDAIKQYFDSKATE